MISLPSISSARGLSPSVAAIDIGIGQTNDVSKSCKGAGEVHGNGGLAYSALAGSDSDYVPDIAELLHIKFVDIGLFFLLHFVHHHGLHLSPESGREVADKASSGAPYDVLGKRVTPFGKGQGHHRLTI